VKEQTSTGEEKDKEIGYQAKDEAIDTASDNPSQQVVSVTVVEENSK
jgi:hypothetical protein